MYLDDHPFSACYKRTDLSSFLAVLQLAQGAEVSCAISLQTTRSTCTFVHKTQTACSEMGNTIAEIYGCSNKSGNGCSVLYETCEQKTLAESQYPEVCINLGGLPKIDNPNNYGECVPLEGAVAGNTNQSTKP